MGTFRINLGQGQDINLISYNDSRIVEVSTAGAVNFFKRLSVIKPDLVANALGLYSLLRMGRDGKFKAIGLNVPKHLLQKRKNGCSWNPKGTMTNNITEIDACPIEYNGEQCPDAFWGDCLEAIFGSGNSVRDLFATVEGRNLMNMILSAVYEGLGNSLYDLAKWGNHPLITSSDNNNWYKVSSSEWADYLDQQGACNGWMTLIDYQKNTVGLPHFNITINTSDVNGSAYVGDVKDGLFKRLVAGAKPIMRTAVRNSGAGIILVSQGIFDKYEEELAQSYPNIPDTFYYQYNGEFCRQNGCVGDMAVSGVLKYKGNWVVLDDSISEFDEITGVVSHRAIYLAKGNLGLGFDVADLAQFRGIGLRVTQRLDAPYQGKVYMDTTFKMATAILDTDLMASAELTLTP